MSNGWGISDNKNQSFSTSSFKQKKYTIHPELLDKSGNITEEELLTVRFSNDNDSTLEEKGSKNWLIKLYLRKKIGIKNKNCLSGNKISQTATKVSFENG